MRAALGWVMLAAAGLAAPAQTQPLTTTVDAVRGPDPADPARPGEEIGFDTDTYDRMTVPVRVGGAGPYRFLVDTGADRTAVSSLLAAQLKLPSGPQARLHSVTGTTIVQTAKVARLELSANRVRSVEAALLERADMGADGILGVDSLRSERVVFDFKNQVISIVPSAHRLEREDSTTIIVRGKLKRGHLIVTNARVNGSPLTVVLDTGSEVTMGNPALRQALEAKRRLGEPVPIQLISVTGRKLVGEVYSVKQLTMGEVTFRDLAVVVSDAAIFGSLGLATGPTLLLGMNALSAFDKVSLDFERKKLRMVMPEHAGRGSSQVAAR